MSEEQLIGIWIELQVKDRAAMHNLPVKDSLIEGKRLLLDRESLFLHVGQKMSVPHFLTTVHAFSIHHNDHYRSDEKGVQKHPRDRHQVFGDNPL